MSAEDIDSLPWLERLNRAIDDDMAAGKSGFAITYVVVALIRALQEKGVLSIQERDAVFAAWDRLEEFHRRASAKEMQALREQFPELAERVLDPSDPP